MTIKLINRNTEGELLMEGRLDTLAAPETEAVFLQVIERFDCVVINMEKMSYISSSGLRVIKNAHMAMMKKGGVLTLKNVNRTIMEVFEMTGFAGLLHII